MSGMRTKNVFRGAGFAKRELVIPLITALSQTGVKAFSFVVGHQFQIVAIRSYCLLKAGTVTANLKVGGRTACAVTFTSATENLGTLSATDANIVGSATEAVTLEYTTDGSGVLTNGFVVVQLRARPMNGDQGPVVLRV